MTFLVALAMVLALCSLAWFGIEIPGVRYSLASAVPRVAAACFLAGLCWRVAAWVRSPVPFRIPTTCGQQRSLSWIRPSRIDNPHTRLGAIARVLLAVFLFRPLLRNTRVEQHEGRRLAYLPSYWLWLGAMMFHGSLLLILLRHTRLWVDPVPGWVLGLARLDGFFELGVPRLHATTVLFLFGLGLLLLRRLALPTLRYVSLPADYFPLLLLLGVGTTGLLLRHTAGIDASAIKDYFARLVTFGPLDVQVLTPLFSVHLLLVSVLFAYFPWSKLMHMAGIWLSPTLNLANNSRAVRHTNPWNPKVKLHSYEQYEDEFRTRMTAAGLPVEKDSP